MKIKLPLPVSFAAFALAALLPASAQDPTQPGQPDKPSAAERVLRDTKTLDGKSTTYSQTSPIRDAMPSKINRASDLIGMDVRNHENEKLGNIKDVVVDLQSGRIAYVVLSAGTLLSPKYIAVPTHAFAAAADEKGLTLNVDKNRLATAVGFDKDNWPNMANPAWGADLWPERPKDHPGTDLYKNPARPNPDLNKNNPPSTVPAPKPGAP